jgi:hypothetical protein
VYGLFTEPLREKDPVVVLEIVVCAAKWRKVIMAKASFYVNDIKVRRKGEFLVLEARKRCQHGTVFDEIYLTLPVQLVHLFTKVEGAKAGESIGDIDSNILAKRFKRFSGNN